MAVGGNSPSGSAPVSNAFARAQLEQKKLADQLKTGAAKLGKENEAFLNTLNTAATQTKQVNENASAALQRLEAIQSNPEFVNRIMGLFDDDFNRDAQVAKLRRSDFQASQIAGLTDQAKQRHGIITKDIQTQVQTQSSLAQLEQQNFINLSSFFATQRQREENARSDSLRSMTLADLGAAMQDPKRIPSNLNPGLIESEFNRKKNIRMDMEASSLALSSGQLGLSNSLMARALAELDTIELAAEITEAKANGGKALVNTQSGHTVAIDQTILEEQFAAKSLSDREKRLNAERLALEAFTIDTDLSSINSSVNAISSITNPGMVFETDQDRIAALPPDIRNAVQTLNKQMQAIQQGGLSPAILQEKVAKTKAMIEAGFEKQLKNVPDGTAQAYREFAANEGKLLSPEVTTNFMVETASNPNLTLNDNIYAQIQADFSKTYSDERESLSASGFTLAGSELSTFKAGDKEDPILLEEVAKQQREGAAAVMFQGYTAEVINSLAQDHQAIFGGIVNPQTRTFTDDVKNKAGEFSIAKLSDLLAKRTLLLESKGVLQPGESVHEMLTNIMQANAQDFFKNKSAGNIHIAALNHLLFANQPHTPVQSQTNMLMALEQNSRSQVFSEAKSLQGKLAQILQAITASGDKINKAEDLDPNMIQSTTASIPSLPKLTEQQRQLLKLQIPEGQ